MPKVCGVLGTYERTANPKPWYALQEVRFSLGHQGMVSWHVRDLHFAPVVEFHPPRSTGAADGGASKGSPRDDRRIAASA